jgi:PEP-CTERM putative exosortase interaction domain
MRGGMFLAAASLGLSGMAQAATVDLNDWSAESYPAVSGFGAGVWNPVLDGSSVTQTVNGQPTIYYSDFDAYGTKVTGTIQVLSGAGDDDFVGFVIGYNGGDTTNSAADYLLVDWKRISQSFNFGAPSSTPGGNAPAGLAVSRVSGIPTADEFWQHVDYLDDAGGGLAELQRGATLGGTGWNFGVDYEFSFDFGPNNLEVFVDGVKQIDIAGSFSNGSLGFYNFSQQNVRYSAFTTEDGSFPDPNPAIPEPATWAMMIGGFALAGGSLRRRRVTANFAA